MNKTVTERGYIYVPDALREEYEAKYADMWQVFNVSESRKDNFMYKFRSIEEWPDICHNPDFV
jgi:bifunctional DNA-binding transcriptional regulator/antitoxin component of YhaV-PrlF toxin-antitoxin module